MTPQIIALTGFRGSDWDNGGNTLFALVDNVIRYSTDRGATFADWLNINQQQNPIIPIPNDGGYYGWAIPLFIPTRLVNSKETMLLSPLGSQGLFQCPDIHADPGARTFTKLALPDGQTDGTAGVFNGFAEDLSGNVFIGWYSIFYPSSSAETARALLYKWDATSNACTKVASWQARHVHAVRVNPHNGFLYVVLGEPYSVGGQLKGGRDAAGVYRSKDGGVTWTCVSTTWSARSVWTAPVTPGLYFSSLGFVRNRVFLGQDTDDLAAQIFYFDDDGRDGDVAPFTLEPVSPLPATLNPAEFFLGAVTMGGTLFFGTQFLKGRVNPPFPRSTRCLATDDGVNWIQVESAATDASPIACLGVMTSHPERAKRLIYSLSGTSGSLISAQSAVLVYNSGAGTWASGCVQVDGTYRDNQYSSWGPPSPWTLVVVTRSRSVFFYCPTSSLPAYIGTMRADGTFQEVGAPGSSFLNLSWSHIVAVNESYLFFYNQTTGEYATGRIEQGGQYTQVTGVMSVWKGWTNIVGLGNGTLLFYRKSDGFVATGRLDAAGIYHDVSAVARGPVKPGWNLVTGSGRGGVIFCQNDGSGTDSGGQPLGKGNWQTARLAADGQFANVKDDGVGFYSEWTHVVGTSVGVLLFYCSSNGNRISAFLDDLGNYSAPQTPMLSWLPNWTQVTAS